LKYTVIFTPEAEEQLAALYRYIAAEASANIAERYTGAIVSYCEGLSTFPHRGVCRDGIRQGLRVTNYKGRTVIAYDDLVSIIGLFYGGQNYETLFQPDL
jgi:plasmid stabilization system protein ParE